MSITAGYMAAGMIIVDESTMSLEPEKNFKVNAYTSDGRRKSLVGFYPNMVNLDTARFEHEDDVRERLSPAIQSENQCGSYPIARIEVLFEANVCSAQIETVRPAVDEHKIGEFNRD